MKNYDLWGSYMVFAYGSLLATIYAAANLGTPEVLAGATGAWFFSERARVVTEGIGR
jgi:hypothetical protein